MPNINVVLITTVATFFSVVTNASPTSNEFVPCNKLAVATLQQCLDNDADRCWFKSKTKYKSCRIEVIENHVTDAEKITAEKQQIDDIKKNI